MGQLINDLVVVYGFSRFNAEVAVSLYRDRRLLDEEIDSIFYLETHPFRGNCMENTDLPSMRDGSIPVLERLNYKITKAGGKAK